MDAPVILFRRSDVLALLKPAGLATQAPAGIASVEAWLREQLYGPGAAGYVGVPHRLDRAVSGVLLMAATPRAARKLSRQFERREIAKEYLAIVERRSAVRADDGPWEWRDRIEKVPEEARARLVAEATAGGREAVTRARPLARISGTPGRDRLLLGLEPLTGRMHQLRVQAASRGLPIVGDLLYDEAADTGWAGPAAAAVREPPIALHAVRIRYTDPDEGDEVVAEAPPPGHWPAAGGPVAG